MFLEGLFCRGSLPVLEKVMSFTEARHEVLVNNVSNFDTVGYQMRDLPLEEFFSALQKAVKNRDRGGTGAPLKLPSTRHLRWDKNGRLYAQPERIPENNILFHDENNRFVEKQMSELGQNALLHSLATELLRGQYNSLQTAIRGRL